MLLFKRKKKKKNTVTIFSVFTKESLRGDKSAIPLARFGTFEEAAKFATRRAYEDTKGHYEQWCALHNRVPEEGMSKSWFEYMNVVYNGDVDGYEVVVEDYGGEEIAKIISRVEREKV